MMKFCQEQAFEQRGSTGAPVICPSAPSAQKASPPPFHKVTTIIIFKN